MRATAWMGAALVAAAAPAFAAQLTIPPGASVALAQGQVDFGCADVAVQGTLSAGSGLVVRARNVTIASGGTLDAGSAWLILGGDWTNAGTFVRGTSRVSLRDECASGPAHIAGNNAFASLSFESATGRTLVLPAGSTTSVSTQLTLTGNGPPIQVVSSNPSQPATIAMDLAASSPSITNAQLGPNVSVEPSGVNIAPTAIAFGGQSMRTTAPAQAVSIANLRYQTLTVNSVVASGPFAVSTHNCAGVLPTTSCTAQVVFTPTTEGPIAGTLTFDTDAGIRTVDLSGTGERSLVTHYYRSILRRAPDAGGKSFWESEAARMTGLGANVNEAWFAMAQFFFFSAEYGSFDRDAAGFVTDLYATFFNRAPDAGGLGFWTGLIAQGMPREVILASFMFSSEFGSFTQAIFGNTAARAEVDTVMDFYRGLLARLPDSGGLQYWVAQFRAAQCQGAGAVYAQVEAISSSFARGSEYIGKNRTDAQYVGDLYNAFLRRGGDLGGVQYWIGQAASGIPREGVRVAFRDSAEFQARVAAIVAQGCLP